MTSAPDVPAPNIPAPDVPAPDTAARRVTLYRTSAAQDRMWFAHRSDPASPLYNVFLAARLDGEVDHSALEAALSDVVAQHDVLRTTFRTIDDELHQLVSAHGHVPLDCRRVPDTASDDFDRMVADAATAPFDLTDGPLMRAVLFSSDTTDHVLLVTFHHIVVDGRSLDLLCRDIADAYAARRSGRAPRWAVPELGYGDVCEWWAEPDRRRHRAGQVDRWREVLTSPPSSVTDLPLDRVRTTAVHAEAGRHEFSLDEESSELVRSVALRCRTTPVSVALAAFASLLGRWGDTDDLVLGLPVAGRTHPDTQDMVGLFVNTLPLRLHVQDTGSFAGLVRTVSERTTDALDAQDAPLDDIVAAVAPHRAPGRTPLFDVLFTGQNTSDVALDLAGTRSTLYEVQTSWTRYDLEMNIWNEPCIRGMLVHRSSLFDDETASALTAAFCELLHRACTAPEHPVGELAADVVLPEGAADRPDTTRDAAEAVLRTLPGVSDVVVLRQTATDGADLSVAYVATEAPVTEGRIVTAARNAGHRVDGVVLVGSVPRRTDGGIDVSALSSAPVVDTAAAEQWQTELRRDDERITVTIADMPDPGPNAVDVPVAPVHTAPQAGLDRARRTETGVPAQCDGGPAPAMPHASMVEALHAAARTDHGVVLVSESGRRERIGYRDLEVSAQRVAASLRTRLQSVNTPVLIAFRDNREFLPVLWGCVLAGAVAVPWAPPAAPDELRERLASVRTTLGDPLIVAEASLHESLVSAGAPGANLVGFAELAAPSARAADDSLDAAVHAPNPDDTVLLLLTSGSTGTSKAVRVTHRMILTRSAGAATMCGVGPQDISLNWMPLDHVGGVVMYHMRDVVLGAEQLQVATTWILADPLRWIDLLGEYHVTNTWAPNFAFGLVAEAAPRLAGRTVSLAQVHHILNGGEAVRRATVSAFLDALVPLGLRPDAVRPSWGMSETCSGETDSDTCTMENLRAGSGPIDVGRPYPGFSIRIVDETCAVVDEGVVGRLQVCGDGITPGYWNDPARTAEAMTDDGWFDTGDLAVLDGGRLTPTGRVKDVVIVNGKNFACEDIEQAVERRCAVRDSSTAAIAVPDAATGTEQVVVITVPAAGTTAADRAALASRVRAATRSVTGHAPIVGFSDWDSLPRTGIGKIQRNVLQAAYRERTLQADIFAPPGVEATTVPDLFAVPRWIRRRRRASTTRVRQALLATPSRGSVSEIADRLERHGVEVRILTDINGLADAMIHRPDLVVLVDETGIARKSATEAAEISVAVVGAYRNMVRILDEPDTDRTLAVLTSGVHAPAGGGPDHLPGQVLRGLLRSAAAESLGLRTRSIDSGPGTTIDDLTAELLYGHDDEVVLHADARWVHRLERLPRTTSPVLWPDRGDAVVLTGGTGALGISLAEHLLGARGCSVLLLGSTDPARTPERASEVARLVAEFGDDRVRVAVADVTDPIAVRDALQDFESHMGRTVSGAVHLAGRFVDGPFTAIDDDALSAVTRAKIVGAGVVHDALADRPGSHLLLCSSVSGYLGAPHAAAYSAANSFLDGLAAWASEHSPVVCRSVAWSMWESTGASRDFTQSDRTAARGTAVLPPELAARMWPLVLATDESHLLAGVDRSAPFLRSRCATSAGPVRTLSVSGASGSVPAAGPVDVFGNAVSFIRADSPPDGPDEPEAQESFRGPLEELVAEQWCAVLGLDEVDRTTSFFDLGGASLHLSRVHDRLQRRLDRELALTDLFRHHTVATLAAHLARHERDTARTQPDTPAARRGRERAAARRRRRTS